MIDDRQPGELRPLGWTFNHSLARFVNQETPMPTPTRFTTTVSVQTSQPLTAGLLRELLHGAPDEAVVKIRQIPADRPGVDSDALDISVRTETRS